MSMTTERMISNVLRDASIQLNNAALRSDEAQWRAIRSECDYLDRLRLSVLRAAVGSQTEETHD